MTNNLLYGLVGHHKWASLDTILLAFRANTQGLHKISVKLWVVFALPTCTLHILAAYIPCWSLGRKPLTREPSGKTSVHLGPGSGSPVRYSGCSTTLLTDGKLGWLSPCSTDITAALVHVRPLPYSRPSLTVTPPCWSTWRVKSSDPARHGRHFWKHSTQMRGSMCYNLNLLPKKIEQSIDRAKSGAY